MTRKINKKFLFYILILIIGALISAYIIEHKLGHEPCKLCLYQRIPYFISIFLIATIFLTKGYEKITLLFLSIIFIASSLLAFYHFGIEQGFFKEALVCTTDNLKDVLSKDELIKQLEQKTISCKDVSFRILGFSLASINTIFSILLSVIFLRMFKDYGKNK